MAGLFCICDTSYELRATSYELRATSYELRATSYELRATSYELRARWRLVATSTMHFADKLR
ncbi:hypothetical protein CWN94_12415 [Vibrio splendidus]|nr:hypothetical protein CWN94_12415 [Vibrio splendidus]